MFEIGNCVKYIITNKARNSIPEIEGMGKIVKKYDPQILNSFMTLYEIYDPYKNEYYIVTEDEVSKLSDDYSLIIKLIC